LTTSDKTPKNTGSLGQEICMIIQLNEIPNEGKSFDFSRKTGELNEVLKDLIGDRDYKIHLDINPVGKSFDVRGSIDTSYNELCSFCASRFDLKVDEKFHELVMGDDQKHIKGFEEDWSPHGEIGVTVIENTNQYDVSNLIHEVLALAEPTQPACREDCKGLCLTCGQELNEAECSCAQGQNLKVSPFSVLKKLKIN
jgi:uncharacterized protein